MSRILFVRHGQASLHAEDYDQLSPLGEEQSQALGRYLGQSGERTSQVFVGPLKRHLQTWEHAVASMQDEMRPERENPLPDFDEHQAIAMLAREMKAAAIDQSGMNRRQWFQLFDQTMRRWISGEVQHEDLETWQQARARVQRGLTNLCQQLDGDDGLVMTSGGAACMVAGIALNLGDLEVYELSLAFRNAAWVEVRYGASGVRLQAFNVHPHLTEARLITTV